MDKVPRHHIPVMGRKEQPDLLDLSNSLSLVGSRKAELCPTLICLVRDLSIQYHKKVKRELNIYIPGLKDPQAIVPWGKYFKVIAVAVCVESLAALGSGLKAISPLVDGYLVFLPFWRLDLLGAGSRRG
ncbi:hypothetical protein STEG23_015501 [Scotinomys teguina]